MRIRRRSTWIWLKHMKYQFIVTISQWNVIFFHTEYAHSSFQTKSCKIQTYCKNYPFCRNRLRYVEVHGSSTRVLTLTESELHDFHPTEREAEELNDCPDYLDWPWKVLAVRSLRTFCTYHLSSGIPLEKKNWMKKSLKEILNLSIVTLGTSEHIIEAFGQHFQLVPKRIANVSTFKD